MKSIIKKFIPKPVLKKYYNFIDIKRYKGTAVECSVCGSHFKIFKPYGVAKRVNAQCLSCGALERHRLLWKYLDEELNFFKNEIDINLLHFAPEKIYYNAFSKMRSIKYTPCDLYPENYSYNNYPKIEKVDITSIPFEDNSFQFIICNHVLEHIPDDNLAMSELFRVMKEGGTGIFQVPLDNKRNQTYEDFSITSPELREKAFGQKDHVRVYGLDYKERLEKAGFKVYIDTYVKSFSDDELFKYGLNSDELIYVCKKPSI